MKRPVRPVRLTDTDHILTENAGWFEVKGFAIRIHATDEGVVVDVYKAGEEDGNTITSCYAYDNELVNDIDLDSTPDDDFRLCDDPHCRICNPPTEKENK